MKNGVSARVGRGTENVSVDKLPPGFLLHFSNLLIGCHSVVSCKVFAQNAQHERRNNACQQQQNTEAVEDGHPSDFVAFHVEEHIPSARPLHVTFLPNDVVSPNNFSCFFIVLILTVLHAGKRQLRVRELDSVGVTRGDLRVSGGLVLVLAAFAFGPSAVISVLDTHGDNLKTDDEGAISMAPFDNALGDRMDLDLEVQVVGEVIGRVSVSVVRVLLSRVLFILTVQRNRKTEEVLSVRLL